MRLGVCLALGALVSGLAACGGGGGGGQSCTPGQTASLTITDTGFSNGANNACVVPGGQVTFTNTGSSAHTVHFDTPQAQGCPADVSVPANSPSAPVTFPTAVNCNFHLDANTALSGTIAVTAQIVSGGGY